MTDASFTIDRRAIGPGHPPYVVAELSANHKGSLERAVALIEAAKAAGADAVKLQTYTADTMTLDRHGPGFDIEGGLWDGRSLYELYQEAHTPWEWHEVLFAKGRELGIAVFSTPFDASAVAFLERFDPPAYKIASFELVDTPLVERVGATGKPMIMSTGLANRSEIAEAMQAARRGGCRDLALLHCVSGYPTPAGESNLLTLADLARTSGVVVGLSDHTLGIAVAVAATALGASLIEKHFTLKRADGGPDAAFSLEPGELKELVEACGTAWEALGEVNYEPTPSEELSKIFRRSLFAVADIGAGEPLTEVNVRSIRPNLGLPPKDLARALGRKAKVDIPRGTPLGWDLLE